MREFPLYRSETRAPLFAMRVPLMHENVEQTLLLPSHRYILGMKLVSAASVQVRAWINPDSAVTR
jgi:hypothetical protein